jgi:hypothetical protein
MSEHPQWSTATRFEAQGSLARPGPMGRIVRLGFGILLLSWLFSLMTEGGALLGTTAPGNPLFWLAALFALHVTPYVVNLGFTVSSSPTSCCTVAGGGRRSAACYCSG